MYFSVVVLVIEVNGQPTTDDDIDKHDISELISVVAELRAELATEKAKNELYRDELLARVERELAQVKGDLIAPVGESAASADNTDTQASTSKLKSFNDVC